MRKPLKKFKNESIAKKVRRKLSSRKTVIGSTERPRLCAIKTNKHLTVQVIDDTAGKTLFSLHTFGKNAVPNARKSVEGAKVFGVRVAEELKSRGIATIVFDRNGEQYKGILASLANSVREHGIQF